MPKEEINTKLDIHFLADLSKPAGKIIFQTKDGKKHSFSSCINRLSGDRLSFFDNDSPFVNDSLKWIRNTFKTLRESMTVIEEFGDFK
jgi:hypothetical protein